MTPPDISGGVAICAAAIRPDRPPQKEKPRVSPRLFNAVMVGDNGFEPLTSSM